MKEKKAGKKYYYEAALSLALKNHLIYSSEQLFQAGESVIVPLKNKNYSAVILKQVPGPKGGSFVVRPILSKNSERARLSSSRLAWLCWLAEYYQHPLGPVLHLSFPPLSSGVRGKKKTVHSLLAKEDPEDIKTHFKKPLLTKEQKKCIKEIQAGGTEKFQVHLLHGVTGSGKTEIYFRLIEPALKQAKSVLILVPEIALTPQHIQRFSLRFPGQVACFHSGLSPKQKHLQWKAVLKEDKKILIGPRSVLFCPLPRLSWIIVDEEHESHFKQEEKLKYHGRDSAVYLGKCLNIPVVLSSATPSLESWWNAQEGKYTYHRLSKRVFEVALPPVEVVDMRKEQKSFLPRWLSLPLYGALKECLERKEQTALFLNQRGESPYVFCSSCSYRFSCANCDIALTQHQSSHLLCHYCGFREEKPDVCPECGEGALFSFGVGTAALQKELKDLFPTACIVRADRDEVKTHKQWAEILERVEKKAVDILIGTQMIAKGLDFPGLSLVGVVLADQGLNCPDFRSAEKSFQLITQVAGRAGRRQQTGRVILQSYNPSHPVIKDLMLGDYKKFAAQELKKRKKYTYPPFGKLALVRVQSPSSSSARKAALNIRDRLKNIKGLIILGPAPAPHFRLINKYRYHLLLKSPRPVFLKQAGALILNMNFPSKRPSVQIYFNRDPVYML